MNNGPYDFYYLFYKKKFIIGDGVYGFRGGFWPKAV